MEKVRILNEVDNSVETVMEEKRRSENCMVDIQNVLKRWRCAINPMVTISGRGIQPNFEIVPLPNVPINIKGTS